MIGRANPSSRTYRSRTGPQSSFRELTGHSLSSQTLTNLATGETWQWRSFREKASEREPAGSLEEAPENFVTDKFIQVIRPFLIMRYLIVQNQNIPFSKTWRGFSENLGILILALLRGANPNTKFSILLPSSRFAEIFDWSKFENLVSDR